MAGPIKRSGVFYDKEVLKFPAGLDAIKSGVLDATTFAVTTTGDRYVVPAGTILKLSATNAKRYSEYDGTGKVQGILARPVDLLARATNANEAVPIFYHQCVFVTGAIVGFTNYASAVVNTLTTCKFE